MHLFSIYRRILSKLFKYKKCALYFYKYCMYQKNLLLLNLNYFQVIIKKLPIIFNLDTFF